MSLVNKKPGDIDMLIVRENTEGEYSSVGGRNVQRYRKRNSCTRNNNV